VKGETTVEQWENDAFPRFSEEMKRFVGDGIRGDIANGFSTSTSGDKAMFDVTLMATMKNFFFVWYVFYFLWDTLD